jgi:hypothetical protein
MARFPKRLTVMQASLKKPTPESWALPPTPAAPLGAATRCRLPPHATRRGLGARPCSPPAPSAPPPRIGMPRGRQRASAPAHPGGPPPAWAERAWVGGGNRRAPGPPPRRPWRPRRGGVWRRYGLEPLGPLVQGPRASGARSVRVRAGRAAGLGIRGTARGGEGAATAGRPWPPARAAGAASHGGGPPPGQGAWAGAGCPHGRRRGRHPRGEGRWEAMRALSARSSRNLHFAAGLKSP